MSFSGIFRWRTYLKPEKYKIDRLQASSSYGNEEIKLYRNRLANKFFTKEMRKECAKFIDNMKELKDFKFNESLTTLQIITTNSRDEYLSRQENVARYATNLITNKNIQKIRTIEGSVDDYLFDSAKIKELKNLISMYF